MPFVIAIASLFIEYYFFLFNNYARELPLSHLTKILTYMRKQDRLCGALEIWFMLIGVNVNDLV